MNYTGSPGFVYPPSRPPIHSRYTMIEDVPQSNLPCLPTRTKLVIPTFSRISSEPKEGHWITPSSDQTSDASSMWSHRDSRSTFDELYDVSDDEHDEDIERLPIKLSASVKRQTERSKERTRYPSLVIPSPSAWPTFQKLQSTCVVGLSPASKIAVSTEALATFNKRLLQSPGTSSAPSLDGSLASEELSLQSCPSTPDPISPVDSEEDWDQPIQLDPYAFGVLLGLQPTVEEESHDSIETIVTVPDEAVLEMQEIVRDTPVRHDFALNAVRTPDGENDEDREAISALSVPSPGGFFTSLAPSADQTWSRRTPEPSTSVAEDFYGVPWREALSSYQARSNSQFAASSSALNLFFQPTENLNGSTDISEPDESCLRYSKLYEQALKQASLVHYDLTRQWLDTQTVFTADQNQQLEESILDAFKHVPGDAPATPSRGASPILDDSSPSKKSVRFADGLDAVLEKIIEDNAIGDIITINDSVFYQAFQDVSNRTRNRDVFIHCQARTEAVQIDRRTMSIDYCKQLRGDYEIPTRLRPENPRPISGMLLCPSKDDEEESYKEVVASAEHERQAHDQVKSSMWGLQAERALRGGKLLNSPAEKLLHKSEGVNILDFGGRPSGDWGWEVALEYRNATIYTIPIINEQEMFVRAAKGPSNHRVVTTTEPWTLPFPAAMFDVISARTLHSLLKTSIPNSSPNSPVTMPSRRDQWDLTLSELHRILKPGGYLEFTVFDAALLHPGPCGEASSVEFTFNLRTKGYDPSVCRTFLSRLRNARFSSLQRGYFVLPMSDVGPRWTDDGKTRQVPSASGHVEGATDHPPTPPSTRTNYARRPRPRLTINSNVVQQNPHLPALTGSTAAAAPLTGLVGARAWEQWMLKLGAEMGRSNEEVVQQVAGVLAEGGKCGAGWKCLMGFARK